MHLRGHIWHSWCSRSLWCLRRRVWRKFLGQYLTLCEFFSLFVFFLLFIYLSPNTGNGKDGQKPAASPAITCLRWSSTHEHGSFHSWLGRQSKRICINYSVCKVHNICSRKEKREVSSDQKEKCVEKPGTSLSYLRGSFDWWSRQLGRAVELD